MDYPPDFRCPISMEVMKDPVTIWTGITYERKNIEKWFFSYKKKTCPATMQIIDNFDVTPNHTLKKLIDSWRRKDSLPSSSSPDRQSIEHEEIVNILTTIESSPFKVCPIKKLRTIIVEMGDDDETKSNLVQSKGVEILVQILVQVLFDSSDIVSFRACEEALGVLEKLPLCEGEKVYELLVKPESMSSMAVVLQRGSAEGRLYTIRILRNIAKTNYDWNSFIQDQDNTGMGIDLLKSLLDLVSDEIFTKASGFALEILIKIMGDLKKVRLRAIEAGAMCVLIELLPDCSRSKCEKILRLIKLLCECAEGRVALVDHGMGIAMVSKKLLHVSNAATKICVKIMYLICSFDPTEKALEEMLVYGSAKKLSALLHMDDRRSSTRDKVVKIFKMRGKSWKKYPCFPCELRECLDLGD